MAIVDQVDAAVASSPADDDLIDAGRDESPDSTESTPEPAPGTASGAAPDPAAQPQKRKGGRKPIYATSEERKQRNRQAQAAFRERRTEYIKQLEDTIKQHEEALRSLQQSHRSAADECLMLRYKNSLLERILLEKSIDVQAELQMKTGSPAFEHGHVTPPMPAPVLPSPLQRSGLQKNQMRRSYQSVVGRRPASAQYMPRTSSFSAQAAPNQPTPSSHASSPTAMSNRSSVSVPHGGVASPGSVATTQSQAQPSMATPSSIASTHRPPSSQYARSSTMSSGASSGMTRVAIRPEHALSHAQHHPQAAHYSTPPDNLGKSPLNECVELCRPRLIYLVDHGDLDMPQHTAYASLQDDQHMLDQDNEYAGYIIPNDVPSYEAHDRGHAASHRQGQPHQQQTHQSQQQHRRAPGSAVAQAFDTSALDAFDPVLDADPSGLTASMHFPTSYSFDSAAPGR